MVEALSTGLSQGQQIVGIFMLGMALGQIPAGLLSDRRATVVARSPRLQSARYSSAIHHWSAPLRTPTHRSSPTAST